MRTTRPWLIACSIIGVLVTTQAGFGEQASPPAVVAWAQHYLKPMARDVVPPAQLDKTIRLRTTPGEYEPAAFAIRANAAVAVAVELKPILGQQMDPSWCELHVLRSLDEKTLPKRLRPVPAKLTLTPNDTTFFWLTVKPPTGTPAGMYRARVLVTTGAVSQWLDIECEVLPFTLADSPVVGGVFMSSTDLPRGWYRDMKEHGIDSIQCFWGGTGIEIENRDGKLVLDFTQMDEFMAEAVAGGIAGPIVISLGNDSSLHYERWLGEAFGMEIELSEPIDGKRIKGPKVTPELDKLFVEGLRQIREHWRAKGYPQELVVLIYDEPTERLLERGKNRYDLLKTAMPDTRVYGVSMNRRKWAEAIADQCDIIVANGDFEGCRDVAATHGKDYWIYGFPLRTVHTSRHDMGLLGWRAGASGVFFWMYNYWGYDPDNCAVYRDADNPAMPIRSIAWEAIREGHDDLRYVATAQQRIAKAPAAKQTAANAKLNALRLSLDPTRRAPAPKGEEHDETSLLKHYSEPQRVRDGLIDLILELQ